MPPYSAISAIHTHTHTAMEETQKGVDEEINGALADGTWSVSHLVVLQY